MSRTAAVAGVLGLALFLTLGQASALAGLGEYSALLTWDANPSPAVAGYRVYYGTTRGNYSQSIAVGKVTAHTISGMPGGVPHYFAITAYSASGTESAFSSEIVVFQPHPSVSARLTASRQAVLTVKGLVGHGYEVQATQNFGTWTALGVVTVGTNGALDFTDTNAANYTKRFYRTREVLLP